ncbi:LysR family transcriptional regulator [Paracoccus fistulariae]|uniref:LysR family transcriptional regulator n=1 Tax=Paracoccus fistulariae TaxID=658446 RepID=A0ABY7SJS9_9RHOB|nr:LysR family transcriptional regulator [Paracoccus fistulariae]MDB6180613.1 LysR family transcriptional regulator [Paracoccus fistulariae]WCR07150.1 LysR family transcriptional regulator [Paracoccus fistulariae]
MRNLDIGTLRSLQAVAEYGAVTRAAEALNMTQSALSMQMKRLETLFDHPVLEKQGRGVMLTVFAHELLNESRKLVAQNDAIMARFTGQRPAGRLRLGLTTDWMFVHVPKAVRDFREANPNIEVVISDGRSNHLRQLFRQNDLDMIMTTEFDCPTGAQHLMKADLAWFGAIGGDAWTKRPLPLANSPSCAYFPRGIAALEAAGIEWEHTLGVGDCEANQVLTAADLGVNIYPRALPQPGLEVIDHGGALPPLPPTWLNVYITDGPAQAGAAEFAGFLRRAVSEVTSAAA